LILHKGQFQGMIWKPIQQIPEQKVVQISLIIPIF
jgi:hypothetical protein